MDNSTRLTNVMVETFQIVRPLIGAVISAVPDFVLAGVFLITWIRPTFLREDMVATLMLLILLEFIIIHSAAFMGSMLFREGDWWRKTLQVLGLGAFYSIFVGGFSLAFGAWWPFISFWGLTANRLIGTLIDIGSAPEQRQRIQQGWIISGFCFVGFTFLTVIFPVPAFGIDDVALNLTGEGIWFDEPQRVIALGLLYFATIGGIEILLPLRRILSR